MNREQRRKAAKENELEGKEAEGKADNLQMSKLQQMPTKVLMGCVGADDDGCGENVFIEYSSLKNGVVLFETLQEIGWFLGVTEVSVDGEEGETEIVHSILCPDCAEEVLAEPAPEGIENVIDTTTTTDVVGE
jgi:hypothetical protein